MKIVVTGAGGQLGNALVSELSRAGHAVVPTDLERRGDGWHALDVTDAEAVRALIAAEKPDTVYHLAAILSATGERKPQATYRVNQDGMFNVLEACRLEGVRQLVFTSTIAVYGPGLPDPTPDDAVLQPTTMYGITKASGELLGAYYAEKYGLDFRALRFPGLISASLPGGGTSDYALFMYVDGVRSGSYEAFCRADTCIPLMYMPDGVRALMELAAAPREALDRWVYNVQAFSPTAAEIADSVARALPGVEITFAADPDRQAILDSWPCALDDSAARADWGWKPAYDLDRMTDELVPAIRELLAERADALDH